MSSGEDFSFGDDLGFGPGEVIPERWERARTEIDFIDLIEEILVKDGMWRRKGNAISCPFHGGAHGERIPSFTLYRGSNSAYCFGCPPPKQNQTYDSISFVSRYYGMSRVEALQWLEARYKLPPLQGAGFNVVEEGEPEDVLYTAKELAPIYLKEAPKLIQNLGDAKDLLKTYFIALQDDNPLPLAQVLGHKLLHKHGLVK